MGKEKYYQCPQCGEKVTETEILNGVGNGSLGMCYCKFLEGSILIPYKKISKKKHMEK